MTNRKGVLSNASFQSVQKSATAGGTRGVTSGAEERMRKGEGMDPLVDPKGLAHLGPIRLSLPRMVQQGKYWVLVMGVPMAEETLLDTTGSMQNNIKLAFEALPKSYEMMTAGKNPVLGRYDVHMANAIFNDVEDNTRSGKPVLCRTQFEMDEKIPMQMTMLVPGRGGCGNDKEDPQFGLFAGVYLTKATINRYGLLSYHFTASDEPLVETISLKWLKHIFGTDVLERVRENGYDFDEKNLPDTYQVVKDLQKHAHAFFLQVPGSFDRAVTRQWTELYGEEHVIMLPDSTEYLHCVKALVIGLTEGVLDLSSAEDFLREHDVRANEAKQIVRAVAHIPLRAQAMLPNFDKLPLAGAIFKEKTDLWPIDPKDVDADVAAPGNSGGKPPQSGGQIWF